MNSARRKLIRRQCRAALRAALGDIYLLSALSLAVAAYGNLMLGIICQALSIWCVVRRHVANISRITNIPGVDANESH